MDRRTLIGMGCLAATLALAGCDDNDDETAIGEPTGEADGGGSGDDGAEQDVDEEALEYAVLVRGPLAETDPTAAKGAHDALAAGGEEAAKALGDFGHDAMLGADLLGATATDFLAIDRWTNAEGIKKFYADPAFVASAEEFYAAPPTLEVFEHQSAWYGWGDLQAGDAHDPHTFVVIRGRLANPDLEASRQLHDMIAAGGEAQANELGDIAHVVFLGHLDPQEFFAVDIWRDDTNLVDFYTNPQFAEAFGALYEGTPTLQVYRSTDWHQW